MLNFKKKNYFALSLVLLLPLFLAACSTARREAFIMDRSSDKEAPHRVQLYLTVKDKKLIKEESDLENLNTKIKSDEDLKSYEKDLESDPRQEVKGLTVSVKKSKDGNLIYHTVIDYEKLDYDAYQKAMSMYDGEGYAEMPDYDKVLEKIEEQGFKKVD